MRERTELILKLTCLVVAALVVYQLSRFLTRTSPLEHLSIPSLPALSAETNAPSAPVAATSPAQPDAEKRGTNSAAKKDVSPTGTNANTAGPAGIKQTNAAAGPPAGKPETNAIAAKDSKNPETISAAKKEPVAKAMISMPGGPMAMMGMGFGPPGQGNPPPDLPPLIKARVERITQSEILGQIMRPLPMALLGIAGQNAFMRVSNGQTGLMKEGEDLGGIKLLRIGTNRVLVEENGQKKELTIFTGFGGDTLLPQSPQNTNETITKNQ